MKKGNIERNYIRRHYTTRDDIKKNYTQKDSTKKI